MLQSLYEIEYSLGDVHDLVRDIDNPSTSAVSPI